MQALVSENNAVLLTSQIQFARSKQQFVFWYLSNIYLHRAGYSSFSYLPNGDIIKFELDETNV